MSKNNRRARTLAGPDAWVFRHPPHTRRQRRRHARDARRFHREVMRTLAAKRVRLAARMIEVFASAAAAVQRLAEAFSRGAVAAAEFNGRVGTFAIARGSNVGRVNAYRCEVCGGVTRTIDVAVGTTPFLIGCRATPGCDGVAASCFYRTGQDPASATHEFYMPSPEEAARLPLYLVDHVGQGGLLLRKKGEKEGDVEGP